MKHVHSHWGSKCLVLCAASVLASCTGGGGGSSDRFAIAKINLTTGDVWRINRAIEIRFTRPVDLTSVTLNSIHVVEIGGGPAAGEFRVSSDGYTIVFQPHCPTLPDLSDAGLSFGLDPVSGAPHHYALEILGGGAHANISVHSTLGEALSAGVTRDFTTPISSQPAAVFFDPKNGPPAVRLLDDPDVDPASATRLEIGASGETHYFRRVNNAIVLDPPLDLPLNEFTDVSTRVAFLVELDQPVDPSAANLDSSRVRLEFRDSLGAWRPLATQATLDRNCSGSGATLRLVPLGLLPAATLVRAVLTPQFSDLVGQTAFNAQDNFAVGPTEAFPTPPAELADTLLEDFDTQRFEDSTTVFAEPRADWSDGALSAKFAFGGTGGPGGNFDWKVSAGETVILNTAFATIAGGPNFQTTGFQVVSGGVVDIDDMWIENGGVVKAEGPNPLVIRASGFVRIDGQIVVNGTSSTGVVTLGTTNTQESGASGQAGGGKGGTGHPVTTVACPRGGNGAGAFNTVNAGGQGGETGWTLSGQLNFRRGAGGGGGRFGRDVPNPTTATGAFDQTRIGMDAEKGFDNTQGDQGAITGTPGPFGGSIGPSPFADTLTTNDFFGLKLDTAGALIKGELVTPWAGEGGGGGGDGIQFSSGTFPSNWVLNGYHKGAGGGGGGGCVRILALRDITFGVNSRIQCRGGLGGGGENHIGGGFARVGGGSGGGSGGHVILETAGRIDFSALPSNGIAILATGGQGGAGSGDAGGAQITANGQVETAPSADACPTGYSSSGANACRGLVDGAGGDGGPGVVQLHTTNGIVGTSAATADIVLPVGATLTTMCKPPPVSPGGAAVDGHLLPTFGRKSHARSKWIDLGQGGFDVGSSTYRDVTFAFAGVNPLTGAILTDVNGNVLGLPSVITGTLVPAPGVPHIENGGETLVFDATPLIGTAEETVLANPALLVHYAIELFDVGDPTDYMRYDVVSASYDGTAQTLALTVDGDGPSLNDFSQPAVIGFNLRPMYFRVRTNGVVDSLPTSTKVQVRLEATSADASGNPNLAASSGLVADPAVLNATPNGTLRFVRFDVLFDIDALGQGLSAQSVIPTLEFFRLPFRY